MGFRRSGRGLWRADESLSIKPKVCEFSTSNAFTPLTEVPFVLAFSLHFQKRMNTYSFHSFHWGNGWVMLICGCQSQLPWINMNCLQILNTYQQGRLPEHKVHNLDSRLALFRHFKAMFTVCVFFWSCQRLFYIITLWSKPWLFQKSNERFLILRASLQVKKKFNFSGKNALRQAPFWQLTNDKQVASCFHNKNNKKKRRSRKTDRTSFGAQEVVWNGASFNVVVNRRYSPC